jgi:hypothetical protein
MNAEKRKLYQARGHLLKAEAILRGLLKTETSPKARPYLNKAYWWTASARRDLLRYIAARWGSIKNLEAYK